MKRIKADISKCVGCLTCVTACMVSHESCDSRNRIVRDNASNIKLIFCHHCNNPKCVDICASGAMFKNKENGLVEYNKGLCVSCNKCIEACPFDALKSDSIEQKEIMKCNMCTHRTENNEPNPMCVEKCPMGAINFI